MLWNLFKFTPQPFNEGYMTTNDGHKIYYRQFGNKNGIPVLSFHGGPGGSSRPKYAKLFDRSKYRFIQFDQRGAGQSTADTAFRNNTTQYLLNDANDILQHLGIDEKVIVHGVSWGATLALLFAEKYPQKVQNIIVSSVFLAREYDMQWVNRESERFYPDLWNEMRKKVRRKDIYPAYRHLLFAKDLDQNAKALTYLGSYEYMLGQLNPHFNEITEVNEEDLRATRIAFYYEQNKYFIRENQIITQADKIKHIPTLIVHNRMDFCCPVKQAWDLHQALPLSKLVIASGYGHSNAKLLKIVRREIEIFL